MERDPIDQLAFRTEELIQSNDELLRLVDSDNDCRNGRLAYVEGHY